MQLGIADMHCQGEFYLVEEILDELKVAQGSDAQQNTFVEITQSIQWLCESLYLLILFVTLRIEAR